MVAGSEELASQHDRQLESALCADLLGPAQRTRILCFPFVLLWGVSGIYLSFPQSFNGLFLLDPADHFIDQGLFWLSQLHFGRFGWFSEVLWSILGLAPAILAFTGVFICCRRVIFKKPSNPNTQPD
jgi:uncharacterized iron-regulated membrane protein